jgi:hypothetical protein
MLQFSNLYKVNYVGDYVVIDQRLKPVQIVKESFSSDWIGGFKIMEVP